MISISTLKIVEGSATLLRSASNYTSLTFLEIKMISDSMLLNDDWLQNLALLEHSHGFENLQSQSYQMLDNLSSLRNLHLSVF